MPGLNGVISTGTNFFRSNRTGLLFSLLYFIPAITWVVLSDSWLFTPDTLAVSEKFRKLDQVKDAGFVLVVGVMIFFMIRVSGKKLRDTKTYYQNLFYLHPNPMWIYDKATLQFLDVNKAATLHYGYSRKEFLSMTAKDIRPAELVKEMTAFVSDMKAGTEYSHTWQHKKKNGELIMVEATANSVEFQKKPCWVISVIDITERHRQTRQLRDIAFTASHKFRKPLANIMGLVNELQHSNGNSQKELQYLKQSAEELDTEIRNIVEKTALLEHLP